MQKETRLPLTKALRAFAILAASWWGGNAVGQQVPPSAGTGGEEPQKLETLVVTGSYLRGAAATGASPVVVIPRATIGPTGAIDALRLLKDVASVFTGNLNTGNEWNNAGFGESYVGMRNLPTLVLLEGRRLINSPLNSTVTISSPATVDLNLIPMSMIERVEVLRDSGSTLYGSDAVGGVINFVLRKNYTGGEFGTRFGTDGGHDYRTLEGWLNYGISRPGFSLTLGVQHSENDALTSLKRKLSYLGPAEFAALGQNPAFMPSYMNSAYAGRNGNFIIAGSPLAVGAPGYNPAIKTLPAKTDPNAPPVSMATLTAAGYYIPISDTPLSKAAGNSVSILNTSEVYDQAIILPAQRVQFFAAMEKELAGKGLRLFGDFLYNQTFNAGSSLSPAPISALESNNLSVPANNPYNLFGVRIGVGGAPGAPGLRARLDELGNRNVESIVDTYRVVLGLRGDVGESWNWEAAVNYSRATGERTYSGAANGVVINQELIPLLDASGGYTYDATGRPLSVYVDPKTGKNVPVFDIFGVGSNAQSTFDAMRASPVKTAQIEHRSVDARVTGHPFALPAGPVAVAVGGEVRRERLSSHADDLFVSGFEVGFASFGSFPARERSTEAVFIESGLPLVAPQNRVPGLSRADLSAAVRYEGIQPGGHAASPKLGLRLMPFGDELVVRGTFSRGFVAPMLFALYGAPVSNIVPLTLPEGNGQTSSGGSTGRLVTGTFVGQVIERGNPHLEASKSESFTGGLVYSPKALKGLTLSADYYHVSQNKVGGFDYTFIVGDLNAKGSDSVYAPGFRFVDGSVLTSNAPNQVTSTNAARIDSTYNPVGDLWTDGVDLAVAYEWSPQGVGMFNAGVDANVPFNFKARTSPTGEYYQYARNFTDFSVGKGNQQGVIPNYSLKAHVHYTYHDLRVQLQGSYIPSLNAPGSAFGAPPGTFNQYRIDGKTNTISSYGTADLSVGYRLPASLHPALKGVSLTAGVNNLFNRDAPFVPGSGGGGGTESNTAKYAYDMVGRFFFAELKKEF